MAALFLILGKHLPVSRSGFRGNYAGLMVSLVQLIRDQPVLRETSLVAALQFAAFSAFWTTLAFQAYSLPGHHGSTMAGLFGVVGVVGTCAAPMRASLPTEKARGWRYC